MSTLSVDDRGILVPCPRCGQTNRLAFGRLGGTGRCGSCKGDLPPPGRPVEVDTAARFERLVAESALPVVVDYWAPWCGPCRTVTPELERVAERHAGRWVVAKVNTDALPDLGARHGIRSIPTMAVFARGREVERTAGARPAAAIEAFVRDALG